MLPQATADLYRADQRRVAALWRATDAEWSRMGDDLDAGWQRRGPRITALTTAAMIGAARDGAAAVPAALAETGVEVAPLGEVVPEAFGRTASDGRPLAGLLYGAVIVARKADAGSLTERLAVGRRWLRMAQQTQVVDAARLSSQAAITARPKVGWTRMVNPPCCQDCAVLAGKFFRYNTGFLRHPSCDCVHWPAHADAYQGDAFTEAIPDLDQITDLTPGQVKALEDGADLGRVVNRRETRRRMSRPGYEMGRRRGNRMRPGSPDWIYANARSREHAVELLTRRGFMRPPAVSRAA